MTDIFIIFMIGMICLAVVAYLVVRRTRRFGDDGDNSYLDREGDHIYYDRSIIEKKNFKRHNPDVKNVRTFRRLFKGK